MLEVNETFTTIWFSRSSEVSVKVKSWPSSPLSGLFLCMLPVAVDQSSSDGVTRLSLYVILRIAGFTDDAVGPVVAESSTTLCLEVRQVTVPVGHKTSTVFGWVRQNCGTGAKSAIYDYLVISWSWMSRPNSLKINRLREKVLGTAAIFVTV